MSGEAMYLFVFIDVYIDIFFDGFIILSMDL